VQGQGRGVPVSMPVGPCRVWYQNRGETLGLAMSRSLGDSIVHRCGVSAEPETFQHTVDSSDVFMIIATDGVWDVLDNNQACQIAFTAMNAATASIGGNDSNWALEAANNIAAGILFYLCICLYIYM
jgi:serine/threonine protein phosphatase PrpC